MAPIPRPVQIALQKARLKQGDLVRPNGGRDTYLVQTGTLRIFPNRETLAEYQKGHPAVTIKVRDRTLLRPIPLGKPMPPAGGPTPKPNRAAVRAFLLSLPEIPSLPSSTQRSDAGWTDQSVEGLMYQVHRERVQVRERISEYSFFHGPSLTNIWPGGLVQGKGLLHGRVDPMSFRRAPGVITVATDFTGEQATAKRSQKVAQPSMANVTQARVDILEALKPKGSATRVMRRSAAARTYSHGLIKVGLGLNIDQFSLDANASFDQTAKTSTVMHRFHQIYYEVGFEPDSGTVPYFFDDAVTLADVKGVAAMDNPPCYISQVSYGRTLLIIATGAFSQDKVIASVNGKYDDTVDVKTSGDWDKMLTASKVEVYVQGSVGPKLVALDNPANELKQYILEGLTFDLNHPGQPVAFQARYLGTEQLATVSAEVGYLDVDRVQLPPVPTQQFPVSDGWSAPPRVYTGILVAPGDTVSISAGGEIQCGIWFAPKNGPGGVSGQAPGNYPLPGQPKYSLIAGFSAESWGAEGGWKSIGSGRSFVYDGTKVETLYLAINDDVVGNGQGAFDVTVDVSRHDLMGEFPGAGRT